MSKRFESVLHSVKRSDITCSEEEWQGSMASNLKQINRGDLYAPSNTFSEGGGGDVRIVSTSQLEGFHSALKKVLARSVSVDVGLRVLDFFILQHNLKIGTKFGRNPPLQHADIITLTRTAALCRGVLPDSPQLEFANELISKPLQMPKYRSATSLDFGFVQWKLIAC
ncbi:hypothetical protein PHMEG_00034279 [Phytophthora megakarya]|uniref:Uncharacterized protein n=1 Tax=Phytophthora megakarya TaxID=4795 RepID=A0A225URD7_9STRA|nr:hypothetical protein PHMEG_00034279 [Phytophthora megakarya]